MRLIFGDVLASPHVAGLVSYFMAKDGVRGPTQSTQRLLSWASNNFVAGVPAGTVNRLAYNGNGF